MMEGNDPIGKLIGNYRIEKLLSDAGGFAKVYLGKHIHLDRLVVIKLLRATQAPSEQKEQILKEARFLETLKHKYILPIRDTGIQDGVPYLVIEFAPNGSLRDRLRERHQSPLSIEEALTILSQVGRALQFAHQHNVLHRDLKPGNILFNADNEALLADFGIALKLDTARTQSVDMVGTPAYMAPEQFAGKASPKSDQYALGCIAYELFTGRKVFSIVPDADQPQLAWIYQHTAAIPVPPTKLNPNLPLNIEQAILKALAKNRDDRYIDISAFLADLGISLPDTSASSRPDVPIRAWPTKDENDIVTELGTMLQKLLDEGDGHFQSGRFEEALAAYEKAVGYNNRSASAICGKGMALEQLKRYMEALMAYNQAIVLDPTFAYAYIGKGNISFFFKRYEEALTEYKTAIRLAPRLAIGYEMLGRTLTELNRYEEALAAYEAAIRHNPASLDSYFQIADLNIKQAFSSQAELSIQQPFSSWPSSSLEAKSNIQRRRFQASWGQHLTSSSLEAESNIQQPHFAQAIEAYDQIIRLKPDTIDAYYKKAALFEQLNQRDEAIATYNQIIILDPRSLDAYQKKALLLGQLKRLEEAVATYNQIIGLNPHSLDAYQEKALLLRQLKRLEEAIGVHNEIIRLKPDKLDDYRIKIALLEQLKRYDEMITTYDQVLRVNPTSLEIYHQKAVLLEQLKRYNEAIATYKKIIEFTNDKKDIREWQKKIRKLNNTKICYILAPLLYLLALNPIVNIIFIAVLFHSWPLLGALFGGTIAITFVVSRSVSSEDEIGCIVTFLAFLSSCGWGYAVGQLTSSFLVVITVGLASLLANGLVASGLYRIMTSAKLSNRSTSIN